MTPLHVTKRFKDAASSLLSAIGISQETQQLTTGARVAAVPSPSQVLFIDLGPKGIPRIMAEVDQLTGVADVRDRL